MQFMATRYSLVVPVFRNEETIPDLARGARATRTASSAARSRWCLVVDGSPDRSLAALRRGAARDGVHAQVLEMSRNFGAFAAIRAGLDRGPRAVFRGDGGRSAGAARAGARVLPQARGRRLRRRLRRARRRATIRSPRARDVRTVLGDLPPPRAARDAARRHRRVRLQPARARPAASRSAKRIRASSDSWSGSACGARKCPIGAARARTARAAGRSRKKITYMLDSSLAFSDLPIRLLFAVGCIALVGRARATAWWCWSRG